MADVIAWIVTNKAMVFGILFAISEGLSFIPGVKSNGIFQLVFGWLTSAKDAVVTPPPAK